MTAGVGQMSILLLSVELVKWSPHIEQLLVVPLGLS